MRILIVHDLLAASGGAERYVREIAAALVEQGHELVFLTTSGQRPTWARAPIYSLSRSAGWRAVRRSLVELEQVLDTVKPDLIYIHNLEGFQRLLLLPFLLKTLVERTPSVLFIHDVCPICPNGAKVIRTTGNPCVEPAGMACLHRGCCRWQDEARINAWKRTAIVRWRVGICRNVGRIIAPSRYIAQELARNGIPPERIVLLPHFTERRSVSPAPRPDVDLLWVGGFLSNDQKGFKAFATMLASLGNLPWQAAVAGDGESLPEAKRLVDQLGLGPRISFLGRLDDAELDSWYARTRLVVVTSVAAESFCLVGIEAMAHGRPVVAFDAGGTREWLVDEVTGFVVPRWDTLALAESARRLLTDPGLAEQFGKAGRELVERRFRRAAHLEGLLATLEAARAEWVQGARGGVVGPADRGV